MLALSILSARRALPAASAMKRRLWKRNVLRARTLAMNGFGRRLSARHVRLEAIATALILRRLLATAVPGITAAETPVLKRATQSMVQSDRALRESCALQERLNPCRAQRANTVRATRRPLPLEIATLVTIARLAPPRQLLRMVQPLGSVLLDIIA